MPKLNLCGDIGLKIGRDGTWYYQGGAIGRKGLVKLFASVLRYEKDGRYYLVTPVEKVPIAVEAMPFIAVEMRRQGRGKKQSLSFRTNVDDTVKAGRKHPLGFERGPAGGFTPFILVRDGLKARLSRPVYYELAALAAEESVRQGRGGVERRRVLPVSGRGELGPSPQPLALPGARRYGAARAVRQRP